MALLHKLQPFLQSEQMSCLHLKQNLYLLLFSQNLHLELKHSLLLDLPLAVDLTVENASIPNAGFERKVVGTGFALGVNKTSAPIEGTAGVYVIKPTLITKAPVLKDHKDYVAKVKAQAQGNAGRVIPALKEEAEIEDNRGKFNY